MSELAKIGNNFEKLSLSEKEVVTAAAREIGYELQKPTEFQALKETIAGYVVKDKKTNYETLVDFDFVKKEELDTNKYDGFSTIRHFPGYSLILSGKKLTTDEPVKSINPLSNMSSVASAITTKPRTKKTPAKATTEVGKAKEYLKTMADKFGIPQIEFPARMNADMFQKKITDLKFKFNTFSSGHGKNEFNKACSIIEASLQKKK